jgi:PPE-repeat protein
MQARAAAAAYETAFAATVPPPAIAANRAQLMSLIASNVLGQNTPAIAATEAHYDQMWTQDAAAMYGYAGSSAAATQVTPFTQPTQTTNPGGNAAQAATAAHAAGTGAHAIVAPSMSAVPQALQGLTSPLQAAPAQAGLAGLLATSPISYLSLLSLVTASISPYTASIGTVNLATRLASQQRSERTSELVEKIAVATGAEEGEPSGDADTPSSGTTLVGSTPSDPGVRGSGVAVAAGMGRAASVGSMSVPQSWLAAAPPPPIRTVTQVQPAAASLSTTPTIAAGPEILLGEMAVASLAGRVMTVSGGRGKPTYTITVTQNPPETR